MRLLCALTLAARAQNNIATAPKKLPRVIMEFALGYEFIDVLPLIKTAFSTPVFLLFELQLVNGGEESGNHGRGQEKVVHLS